MTKTLARRSSDPTGGQFPDLAGSRGHRVCCWNGRTGSMRGAEYRHDDGTGEDQEDADKDQGPNPHGCRGYAFPAVGSERCPSEAGILGHVIHILGGALLLEGRTTVGPAFANPLVKAKKISSAPTTMPVSRPKPAGLGL